MKKSDIELLKSYVKIGMDLETEMFEDLNRAIVIMSALYQYIGRQDSLNEKQQIAILDTLSNEINRLDKYYIPRDKIIEKVNKDLKKFHVKINKK
jgi:hypothetical protein